MPINVLMFLQIGEKRLTKGREEREKVRKSVCVRERGDRESESVYVCVREKRRVCLREKESLRCVEFGTEERVVARLQVCGCTESISLRLALIMNTVTS